MSLPLVGDALPHTGGRTRKAPPTRHGRGLRVCTRECTVVRPKPDQVWPRPDLTRCASPIERNARLPVASSRPVVTHRHDPSVALRVGPSVAFRTGCALRRRGEVVCPREAVTQGVRVNNFGRFRHAQTRPHARPRVSPTRPQHRPQRLCTKPRRSPGRHGRQRGFWYLAKEASISRSVSARPSQVAPSTDLPGSRSL